jgi:hypothetical protein
MLAALAPSTQAQSLQRFGIQGSGAIVVPGADDPNFDHSTRLGWEAQFRYTISRLSVGAGYQRSTVFKVQGGGFSAAFSVVFVEPRYVATAGSKAAFYLAGRGGVGKLVCSPEPDCAPQEWGAVGGGGGGVLILVSRRTAIDLGAQFFTASYDTEGQTSRRAGYLLARLGLSVGL